MKKALIIGANGKIGRKLTKKLKDSSGWEPVAMLRKESQRDYFNDLKVDSRVQSLEEETSHISEAMNGIDAVVFTAGSGPDTGYDKTLSVDLDGAVKAMEAARDKGVNRFVMVSAMNTGKKSTWEDSEMKPYYIAKYYADEWLKNSGLTYTILRPGRLTDQEGTGKISTTNAADQESVPREDVAAVALEVLENGHAADRVIEFTQGDTLINEAVRSL